MTLMHDMHFPRSKSAFVEILDTETVAPTVIGGQRGVSEYIL